MRIERLLLTAFGLFHGCTIDLAPGLNVIYGPNESGKTTIQKFILGMLYGFKKRGQRREYTDDLVRYRPWRGEEYRGALQYFLDSTGRSYRVERVFEPAREKVALYEATTGADLTATFPVDRRKEVLFAEEQLRLTAEMFTSTAWVGQMEVGRLEMGRELVQRVANLSESGREDLSVRAALHRLEERMRDIGSLRAPTRPYARLVRSIEERRQELERAQRIRQQTLEWEAGLQEAVAERSRVEAAIAEAKGLLTWAELRERTEQLERLRRSTAQMEAAERRARELSAYARFPASRQAELRECEEQLERATAAAERHRPRVLTLRARRDELAEQLRRLQGVAGVGADAAAEVAAALRQAEAGESRLPGLREELARLDAMIARIEEAMEPMAAAAESGAEALTRINELDQEIGAARARLSQVTVERLAADVAELERQRRRVGGWAWAVLTLLLWAAAGASWLPLPQLEGYLPPEYRPWVAGGLGALGLLTLIPFLLARRTARILAQELVAATGSLNAARETFQREQDRIRSLENQREMMLRNLGVLTVTELQSQLVRYEQLAARRDGQAMRREAVLSEIRRAETEVETQRAQVSALLTAAFGEEAGAHAAGAEAVARLQEAVGQYQAARQEWEAVQRELAERERWLAEAEEQADAARAGIQAILSEAGVADAEAFAEGCRRHAEWQRAEQEAEGLRRALDALMAGTDPDALERETDRLRTEVAGEAPAQVPPSAEVRRELARLEAERSEWTARASDLAARVETAAAEVADTADLEREIALLTEERQALEEELAALELARSVITEVSSQIHREFAPRLNYAMGRIVSRITGGRYQTVRIDEDLNIRAIAEGEQTVELTSLSAGTVDQFYLALRVAMLDILTEGQERIPLFLDDPFVQYDSRRLEAVMGYLAGVAEERQVVLMTCHQREAEMSQGFGAHIVKLWPREE